MNKSKRKGYLLEHYLDQYFNAKGIKCQRIGQPNSPDLVLEGKGTMECKCWKAGLKTLYKMLGDNNFLAVKYQSKKAKGREVLVIMKLEEFVKLLK